MSWRCGPGYRVVSYLGVSKKAGNTASLGVSDPASLASEEEDPDEAASGLGASEETPRPMAFLIWSETRATSAFLCWIEALATSAFLCWIEALATSALECWAETPRAMAFLKGLDPEILSCRVHFVTKFAERVKIIISAGSVQPN